MIVKNSTALKLPAPVISGKRCANVGSIPATRSTIVVLYCPDGVSKMVPIGTLDSFAISFFLKSCSVAYVALCEIPVDTQEKITLPA